MIAITSSIVGLLLFVILNYFFVMKDISRMGKIIFGILSLIPFLGAGVNFIVLIIGIFDHCLPCKRNLYDSDKFPVRDTKLNRLLFNGIDWHQYDEIQKLKAYK